MTPQKFSSPAQRGHTLPELLLGMTLSLLVIAAATAAYSTSKHTWNAMAASDAVHANARVALRNIRAQADMAGAAYLTANTYDNQFSVEISLRQTALTGANLSAYGDSLTLSHWRTLDATDCQGNTGSTHTTVANHYKQNTQKELSCKDLNLSGSTYQALAEGVEDFQLRYAEANPNTQTLQWKHAHQVTDMAQVLAIEVCLRVASISTVHNAKPKPHLKGCQDETLATDGRVRRTFKRVMTLRNREGVMP